MRIKRATFFNWMRYRGEHVIELDAQVYGVVAEHRNDPERSNWLCKSGFIEGLGPFPLFGWHRFRTEDEWITNGESEGFVEIEYDDGFAVKRRRQRGKATRLEVEQAHDDAAQKKIDEHIGLGQSDFFATCFFLQKRMSQFIIARPAQRMEVVTEWLDLAPLERAGARAQRGLAAAIAEEAKHLVVRGQAQARIEDMLGRYGVERAALSAELGKRGAAAERKRDAARKKAEGLRDRITDAKANRRDAEGAAAFRDIEAKLKSASTMAAVVPGDSEIAALRREHEEQQVATRAALTEVNRKRLLVQGKFDGRCPVDSMFCPVADDINARRAPAKKLLAEAEAELAKCTKVSHDAQYAWTEATEKARAESNRKARVQSLEEQLERHRLAHERAKKAEKSESVESMQREADEAQHEADEAEQVVREVRRDFDTLERAIVILQEVEENLEAVRKKVATAREAAIILGRNGAQRRIAESSLAEIEAAANAELAQSNIDLAMFVRWARETKGLATACDVCGAPFPASKAVKGCERCGAARGPKLEERLDIDLTDRSGAAEDLAGIAFQLAAGAWLRARRSSAWSTAFIDEPFGALDDSNRRALATHLATMLRGRYGFDQSFVIAHNRGIMDALPGRIRVLADNDRSTVEVS